MNKFIFNRALNICSLDFINKYSILIKSNKYLNKKNNKNNHCLAFKRTAWALAILAVINLYGLQDT